MERNDCSLCCQDLQIPLQHLLLPESYLDADGIAFLHAHGIDRLWLTDEQIHFEFKGQVVHITLKQLAMPDVFGDEATLALHHELGLFEAIRENVTVRVLHRCDQLDSFGLCRIYDVRPKVCREFDCATKHECSEPAVVARRIPLQVVH